MDALQKTMCDTVVWDNQWSALYLHFKFRGYFYSDEYSKGLFIDLLPATHLNGGCFVLLGQMTG